MGSAEEMQHSKTLTEEIHSPWKGIRHALCFCTLDGVLEQEGSTGLDILRHDTFQECFSALDEAGTSSKHIHRTISWVYSRLSF